MTNIRQNHKIVSSNTPLIFGGQKHSALDTLAQLDHNSLETLKKRAISKYYTNQILYPLIDLNNERNKQYWNTYHCVRVLEQTDEGKITSKYCKNRFCIVCNRIRTGILINGYMPVIQQWKDTRFLTLTIPNVPFEELESTLNLMKSNFVLAWRRMKRKVGITEAIRKIEVTYNERTKTYHPHFHILLNREDCSNFLLNAWLNLFPTANRKGQDERQGNTQAVIEMFKYFTKMWKKIENEGGTNEKRVLPYPPIVMDNIFSVMQGQRTIQTYGNIKLIDDDFENNKATVFLNEKREYYTLWDWEQELRTWVDYSTGELRT